MTKRMVALVALLTAGCNGDGTNDTSVTPCNEARGECTEDTDSGSTAVDADVTVEKPSDDLAADVTGPGDVECVDEGATTVCTVTEEGVYNITLEGEGWKCFDELVSVNESDSYTVPADECYLAIEGAYKDGNGDTWNITTTSDNDGRWVCYEGSNNGQILPCADSYNHAYGEREIDGSTASVDLTFSDDRSTIDVHMVSSTGAEVDLVYTKQ